MLTISNEKPSVQRGVNRTVAGYLAGAVDFIGVATKFDAKNKAEEYIKDASLESLTDHPKETKIAIAEKEKELKAAAKEFSLKTKLDYEVDGLANRQKPSIDSDIAMGMLAVSSSLTLAVAAGSTPEAGSELGAVAGVALTGALAYSLGKRAVRAAVAPKSNNAKVDAKEYAEIKHAQLALKQLKRVIEAPEKAAQKEKDKELINKALAAGMGSTGGFIVPMKNGGR